MKAATSSERSFRRRFAILQLLHMRAYTRDDLLRALDSANLLDCDSYATAFPTPQHIRQFRKDIAALKLLDCHILCDRRTLLYRWHNSPFGLAFDPAQVAAFATLYTAFADSHLPNADTIQAVLGHLLGLLPPDQQTSVLSGRQAINVALHETTDYRAADPATIRSIESALRDKVQLEFCYHFRTDYEDRYIIKPHSLTAERGHVYLVGWNVAAEKNMHFRLDRILPGSVKPLAQRVQNLHQKPKRVEVCFRLDSHIAREKVSDHFVDQRVEYHPNGSATITAQITNMFEARRILLSYGEHCHVLSPPDLIEGMKRNAAVLFKMYCATGN